MNEKSNHLDIPEEVLDDDKKETIDQLVQSKITSSGNSSVNVDIKIEVDVKPIAFAIIYSLFAKNELTETQMEDALKKLGQY